uniref:Uncharacterized protein n=1 Tax=Salix viminalis TaxID=40686 RepID=A0A6N2LGM3_SALVM
MGWKRTLKHQLAVRKNLTARINEGIKVNHLMNKLTPVAVLLSSRGPLTLQSRKSGKLPAVELLLKAEEGKLDHFRLNLWNTYFNLDLLRKSLCRVKNWLCRFATD